MSANRHNVYFREDGKSALIEFRHGNTDYNTVGRITFIGGHPGSHFAFEKVGNSDWDDFSVPADELFAILNRLTGNEKFPPQADPSIEDTQVIKMQDATLPLGAQRGQYVAPFGER